LFLYLHDVEYKKLRIREVSQDLYTFNEDEVKDHVIYESDSLNDCLDLDLLSSLYHADKYNL